MMYTSTIILHLRLSLFSVFFTFHLACVSESKLKLLSFLWFSLLFKGCFVFVKYFLLDGSANNII